MLSGCVNMTVTQKLYRDGTSDLILELSSENEFIRNSAFNQVMTEMEGAVVVETEKGFRITKEGIQVSDLEDKETAGIIADTGFKKEFKFPFYYYTITIDNKGMESPEEDEFGFAEAMMGSMAFNYVLEPFGTITETNGIYVGESKKAVKFNLLQSKVYTVTFRDFFLWSWIGGASKLLEREPSKVEIDMSDLGASEEPTMETSPSVPVVQEPEPINIPEDDRYSANLPSRTLSIYEQDRACEHMKNHMEYCHEVEGKDVDTCARTAKETTEMLYDQHGEKLNVLMEYCALTWGGWEEETIAQSPEELLAECYSLCMQTGRQDDMRIKESVCPTICQSYLRSGTEYMITQIESMKQELSQQS